MLMPFISFVQPMLLEEILKVPRAQQGTITGILIPLNDIVVIAIMLLLGTLSDRFGRRLLFAAGLVVFGIGIALNPFADSLYELLGYRMIVGLGFGATMVLLATLLQDYPRENFRATFMGINSILAGLGILFMALVLAKLPELFTQAGYTPVQAITYTFWAGGGMAVLAGLAAFIGLFDVIDNSDASRQSLFAEIRAALLEAKRNRLIGMSFVAGYASRGDLAIVGVFFSLWFMNVGLAQGMESADIIATSGRMFGVITIAGIITGPLVGRFADKIPRDVAVIAALSLATIAYLFMGLVEDPFQLNIIVPACLLLGVAEIAAIVTCAALVGQEAPVEQRGAVMSCFQTAGTIGIASCVFVGGILFDRVAPTAPFLLMACVNFLVVVFGVYTRRQIAKEKLAGQ